jgi:hypothetical protein
LLTPGAGVLFENIIDVYTGIQIELQPKFSYFADFCATKKKTASRGLAAVFIGIFCIGSLKKKQTR